MLEVKSNPEERGIWVGNGAKCVWIDSDLLDRQSEVKVITPDISVGEVVFLKQYPLTPGKKYTSASANKRATEKAVVLNDEGYSFQYLDDYWYSSQTGVNHRTLPEGIYTSLWSEQ